MTYQENKIVIFDWGGVVESHREGECNCDQVTINIVKKLNPQIKENEIIKKWQACRCDENGKDIGTCKEIYRNLIMCGFHLKWEKENQIKKFMKWYRRNVTCFPKIFCL